MNAWTLAAAVLMAAGVGPCLWTVCRGDARHRLVGLALAAVPTAAVLLLLAQGLGRSSYTDLALVLAVLAPAGTLVYVRLLGHCAAPVDAAPGTGSPPDGAGGPAGSRR